MPIHSFETGVAGASAKYFISKKIDNVLSLLVHRPCVVINGPLHGLFTSGRLIKLNRVASAFVEALRWRQLERACTN